MLSSGNSLLNSIFQPPNAFIFHVFLRKKTWPKYIVDEKNSLVLVL